MLPSRNDLAEMGRSMLRPYKGKTEAPASEGGRYNGKCHGKAASSRRTPNYGAERTKRLPGLMAGVPSRHWGQSSGS
jgi:hypothetical protein